MPQRSALIVANDRYNDPGLSQLRAPVHDAETLARVLADPHIGGFQVTIVSNEEEHRLRREIARFFADRHRDDLLLAHLSCHGVKDDNGQLYFATADTELTNLDATAMPADFVNRHMTRSASRRVVLLLDCCYSGAFARGMTPRADSVVDLRDRFEGRGRIVLTASSAMEYAFEDAVMARAEGQPSVFTHAIVQGLETGAADRDGDGYVSVDELYDYVYERVRDVTPKQTPGRWDFDMQGDLLIARNPLRPGFTVLAAPVGSKSPPGHRPTTPLNQDAEPFRRPLSPSTRPGDPPRDSTPPRRSRYVRLVNVTRRHRRGLVAAGGIALVSLIGGALLIPGLRPEQGRQVAAAEGFTVSSPWRLGVQGDGCAVTVAKHGRILASELGSDFTLQMRTTGDFTLSQLTTGCVARVIDGSGKTIDLPVNLRRGTGGDTPVFHSPRGFEVRVTDGNCRTIVFRSSDGSTVSQLSGSDSQQVNQPGEFYVRGGAACNTVVTAM
jgi:Caspase domain